MYCFTAPWNIVLIPIIIDPFTGHEAKGQYADLFKRKFRNKIIKQFKNEISEYNHLMDKWNPKIRSWVVKKIENKDREDYLKEFQKIKI